MKYLTLLLLFNSSVLIIGQDLFVNELMTANVKTLENPDLPGNFPDWIELYNAGSAPIDLSGLFLSDNKDNLDKCQIPFGVNIPANGYLVLYASNRPELGALHLAMKLSSSDGGIYLVDRDGKTILDFIKYKQQFANVSYGRRSDGDEETTFLKISTPGAKNVAPYYGKTKKAKFSHSRGYYTEAFDLSLSAELPQAKIYYTLNGSDPRDTNSAQTFRYTNPIPITTTTCVRAILYRKNYIRSESKTHTYIFAKDVKKQPEFPQGFSTGWAHTSTGDFEMDPDVVNAPEYAAEIEPALMALPTLSLVMAQEKWFGDQGIYTKGQLIKRKVSAELFNTSDKNDFQTNCAVKIVGGTSTTRWRTDKLSMRLDFDIEFGEGTLNHPLCEGGTDSYKSITLDAIFNNSWTYGGQTKVSIRNDLRQNDIAQYSRDMFVLDLHRASGGTTVHYRRVHLYINGLYWGMYWIHERPDANFAAEYFGGSSADYDILKHTHDNVAQGSNSNYLEMIEILKGDIATLETFEKIKKYLHLPSFIRYYLNNLYLGNGDWDHHNWYATHNAKISDGQWRFHDWDSEHVMQATDFNRSTFISENGPSFIHSRMLLNDQYKLMFLDKVNKEFFVDGMYTPAAVKELYKQNTSRIYLPLIAESARWGDNRRAIPYTRNLEWQTEYDYLMDNFFENRAGVVLAQLQKMGIASPIGPPKFYYNNKAFRKGYVDKSDLLAHDSENKVYYTLNGEDPVLFSEGEAFETHQLVKKEDPKKVLVPQATVLEDWYKQVDFDDSSWLSTNGKPGGVGYEADAGYQDSISLDLTNYMYNPANPGGQTCMVRIKFNVDFDSVQQYKNLNLSMLFDDGFVAWINGVRVASENAPDNLSWNALALTNTEAKAYEEYSISLDSGILRSGENILAIQGLNVENSSDFILNCSLKAFKGSHSKIEINPNAILAGGAIRIDSALAIQARATDGKQWSAKEEVWVAVKSKLEALTVTELHFAPERGTLDGSEYEFIELYNPSDEPLNLGLVQFASAIDYTFSGGAVLGAKEYLVLASNASAFKERYGFYPHGEYNQQFDKGGEFVSLVDLFGDTLVSFHYNNDLTWNHAANNNGYSLITNYVQQPYLPNNPYYWTRSCEKHGSPGQADRCTVIDPEGQETAPMKIYPNPIAGETVIVLEGMTVDEAPVSVYDIQGKPIEELTIRKDYRDNGEVFWDTSQLTKGIYLVKAYTGRGNVVSRVIKF